MKTVYDLHRFWTSMSAIFGFTFHMGRMTEVLTPDIYIYIELTGTDTRVQKPTCACFISTLHSKPYYYQNKNNTTTINFFLFAVMK